MRILGIVFALTVFAATTFAEPPSQVFHPARLPKDSRLTPYHLDRPFSFNADYSSKEAWEKRAEQLKIQLLVSQGLWPMPPKTPINPVIHGKIDRDDYTIEKVYFSSMPGHYVCGNLYRPKNIKGKVPVILNPHGHFNNGRFFEESPASVKANLASGGEKRDDGAKFPLQACAVGLCRLGCIVFHYDMVGNADSQTIPHRAGFNGIDAELRLQSAMGLQTWNSIRALDFVCDLPDVDTSRIGVTGASGGGTQTFLLCAIDPRPTVSFPAVMVSANMQGGCICENASLLRVGTNNVELAALFAPKAQAMTGADDWTRDIETHGLPELKRIYSLYGAADQVHAKYYPFPHNYNQVSREMLYGWFNRHFGLGHPEPIVERSFIPVPTRELSVFDQDHPRPVDFLPADALRQKMTATSEEQLASLRREDPKQFRRVVKKALGAMCVTSLPEPGSVHAIELSTQALDGVKIWKGTLQRTGSGEELPLLVVSPTQGKFSGVSVVWASADGKASLFDGNGSFTPSVRRLLDAGMTVLAGDVFLTGEWNPPGGKTPVPLVKQVHHKDIPFLGFWLGYNRSIPAQRVHDLLTIISHARLLPGNQQVWLFGGGDAGPWALMAKALAGKALERTAIDLHQFEFNQVQSAENPMLLPGALKYGGMAGVVEACGCDAITTSRYSRRNGSYFYPARTLISGTHLLPPTPNVATRPAGESQADLVNWLLGN